MLAINRRYGGQMTVRLTVMHNGFARSGCSATTPTEADTHANGLNGSVVQRTRSAEIRNADPPRRASGASVPDCWM
jgi:hypothetical protein